MGSPPRHEDDGAQSPTEPAPSAVTPTNVTGDRLAEGADHTPPGWAPDEARAGDGDAAGDRRRLTRRRVVLAALFAAACAVVAIVLASDGHGKGGVPATGVPAGETTVTVTRRTLTESSTVDGTLGYGATLELYDRLTGTYTWLPAVGATISRGGALFRVDNLPVVLMYGTVPAYRTLKEGIGDGPDLEELNRNLIDLGYDPDGAITDLEAFGEPTAAAVRRWEKDEGLPETGKVELGRVVFAPSARRVTTVHVALGQDPTGAELAAGSTGDEGTPETSPGSGEKSPSTAGQSPGTANQGPDTAGESPGSTEAPKPATGETPAKKGKPKGEKPGAAGHDSPSGSEAAKKEADQGASKPTGSTAQDAGSDPQSGNSSPAKDAADESSKKPEGGAEGAGEAVLTTTSTQQLVQLKLKAEQQQLAHLGERAPVALPGGGVVQGTIVEVGTVASEAKGAEGEKGGSQGEGSGESTIPVTLELAHPVPHLDQAPVSVELVKSVSRNVLAVPATALTATAGGGYAIETLEGHRRVQLSVTPGMFANGYVQVQGAGLHEGQMVIESE